MSVTAAGALSAPRWRRDPEKRREAEKQRQEEEKHGARADLQGTDFSWRKQAQLESDFNQELQEVRT